MSLHDKLKAVLEAKSGERDVHALLKKHPELLQSEVTGFGFCYESIPEFQLGAELRADFLFLRPDSPGWTVSLIELESPTAQLYTRRGMPTRALLVAQRQIQDWRDWIRQNESYFRARLARIIENAPEEKKLEMRTHFDPTPRHDIERMRCTLLVDYVIVIGRSTSFSKGDQARYSLDAYDDRAKIMTYDRLLRHAAFLEDYLRRKASQ